METEDSQSGRITVPAFDEQPEAAQEKDQTPRTERGVWLIAPGDRARQFDAFQREGIIAIGWDYLGNLSRFADVDALRAAVQQHRGGEISPNKTALACWRFAHEIEVGDEVFAKRGRREIVGYGVITSEYRHQPERGRFTHVRSVDWKKRGNWKPGERLLAQNTLTDIGKNPNLVADIRRALGIANHEPDIEPEDKLIREYTIEDALNEMFLSDVSTYGTD